jgi:hypothetical protein
MMTSFQGKQDPKKTQRPAGRRSFFRNRWLEKKQPRTDVSEGSGFFRPLYTDSLFSLHEDAVNAPERKVF